MTKDSSERLSISLTEEDSARLSELLETFGGSKSEIYREALKLLYELNVRGVDSSSLLDHLYLLHKRKSISFNKEIVEIISEELDLDQEGINEKIYDIGGFYWREYRDEGYDTLEELVRLLENHNWFRVIKKEKGNFTLDLKEENLCEIIKSFLRGIFDQSPYEVRIEDARGKILIKKQGPKKG